MSTLTDGQAVPLGATQDSGFTGRLSVTFVFPVRNGNHQWKGNEKCQASVCQLVRWLVKTDGTGSCALFYVSTKFGCNPFSS